MFRKFPGARAHGEAIRPTSWQQATSHRLEGLTAKTPGPLTSVLCWEFLVPQREWPPLWHFVFPVSAAYSLFWLAPGPYKLVKHFPEMPKCKNTRHTR